MFASVLCFISLFTRTIKFPYFGECFVHFLDYFWYTSRVGLVILIFLNYQSVLHVVFTVVDIMKLFFWLHFANIRFYLYCGIVILFHVWEVLVFPLAP